MKLDRDHADRYQAAYIKPKDKLYKVNDHDGLYDASTPAGSISFRYNYSIHGRLDTIKRRPLLYFSMLP
jgi:hypothetical protein